MRALRDDRYLNVNTLSDLLDIASLGAGIKLVEKNELAVTPRCLAIDASFLAPP